MMREPTRAFAFAMLISLLASDGGPAFAQVDLTSPYPAEVALSQEGDKGFIFRRNPGSQRLYTYDLDRADRSFCNEGCDGARPPVPAPASAKTLGLWTVVRRDDGSLQWAYRGHPVYTMYHDAPDNPTGDGEDGRHQTRRISG